MRWENEGVTSFKAKDHIWLQQTERFLGTDARLVLCMRGLRSFAYGLLAVLLSVALSLAGFSPTEIGILITVSLIGDFVSTYLIALFADHWGRRRTLFILAVLMAATGIVFGVTHLFALLLVAAFFGTLGISASETAPFLPIDQAMLSQTCAPEQRTARFAHYNLVASWCAAIGALAAGLPDLLIHLGVPLTLGIRLLFGVYALVALIVAAFSLKLSSHVEAPEAPYQATHATQVTPNKGTLKIGLFPALGRARKQVLQLTGLFSVDALSGGLIVQSLLALFFHLRFGVSLAFLAALFFGANTLSALSFLAAAPLARRIGLLNTMVFTHLPSNILLALVALMPTFPLAAGLLLLRQLLAQMDIPTRQAYTMALVEPSARTAAASVTSLARSAGAATSPVIAGWLLQGPGLIFGLPLLVAGGIKSVYDLTLWAIFRQIYVEEETLDVPHTMKRRSPDNARHSQQRAKEGNV